MHRHAMLVACATLLHLIITACVVAWASRVGIVAGAVALLACATSSAATGVVAGKLVRRQRGRILVMRRPRVSHWRKVG